MKVSSNKVLKISRLIDFNEGISIIEEGDEEISIVEPEGKNFLKKNRHTKKGNFMQKP